MNLEVDFLLVPSKEELQDMSSDDTYSGPLYDIHQSGQALENECRDIVKRWSDIRLHWSSGEEPGVCNYAPTDVITTVMAWVGSATGASLLYRLLKMWVGTRKRKIVMKLPGGLHIETTQLSGNQFIELLGKLAELGLVTTSSWSKSGRHGKNDRFSYLPDESRKDFDKVLDALKAEGVEAFDAHAMEAQERMLRHIFMHTLGEIRDSPNMAERSDRFTKHVEEWIAKGRPAWYLSSPEQRDQWLPETGKREKAVKKLDKAVRKAVDKGVSPSVVESTVEAAITKAAKGPAKKSAALENSDPDAEPVTSKAAAPKLKKLPGKTKPPTLTLKRGKNS